MPDYRQSDLETARLTVPGLSSKQYERIAKALAAAERKGAEKVRAERELRLVHEKLDAGELECVEVEHG